MDRRRAAAHRPRRPPVALQQEVREFRRRHQDLNRPRRSYGGDRYGGQGEPYRGSRWSDGHRTTDFDRGNDRERSYGRDYGDRYSRDRGGYDRDERGFFDRAGDEVRSWFGDEEAERRRERDAREDARRYGASDDHYHSWRRERVAELDRDYDEYRRENAQKFHSEFNSWRTERQGQRQGLSKVSEHMEVVGSDGGHVGTVDKVRGDRIILTKNDTDAGGHHHSIPSRWIQSVDDKVTIRKTADEAKSAWKDEERSGALFGEQDDQKSGARYLNRSFSGTY